MAACGGGNGKVIVKLAAGLGLSSSWIANKNSSAASGWYWDYNSLLNQHYTFKNYHHNPPEALVSGGDAECVEPIWIHVYDSTHKLTGPTGYNESATGGTKWSPLWLGHLADVCFSGIPEEGGVLEFDAENNAATGGTGGNRHPFGMWRSSKDLTLTTANIGISGSGYTLLVSGDSSLSGNTVITGGTLIIGSTITGDVEFADNLVTRPKLKDYAETVNVVGNVNSSTAFDFEDGNVQTVTVAGIDTGSQIVFSLANPPASGIAGTMTVIFTNGLAHGDVAFHSSIEWPGGVAPSLSASGVDIISFTTIDAGTTYYGFVGGINFS
jgi:hypothetical protein